MSALDVVGRFVDLCIPWTVAVYLPLVREILRKLS